MKITSVKEQKYCYIINGGEAAVPKDERNADYVLVQQWIKDGGQVEAGEELQEGFDNGF